MKEYHKINTVFKRGSDKKIIIGEYSLPEFEYLKDNEWEWTEKVDGMNIRIIFDGGVRFGGKTDNAQLPVELVNRLNELFYKKVDLFREMFGDYEVCFYGEGYGAGIQKGGKYKKEQDFVLFDVKIGYWWVERNCVINIAERFGVEVVPIVGYGNLTDIVEYTRPGFSSRWGDFIAEGIVARPVVGLKDRSGNRIITKIKYKDFI